MLISIAEGSEKTFFEAETDDLIGKYYLWIRPVNLADITSSKFLYSLN